MRARAHFARWVRRGRDPSPGPAHIIHRVGDEAAGAIRFESTEGRWIVAVSVLGSGIAFLEATVVNVALPEIGRDLGADTGALQWTLNGYLVTLSALILLGGSLGDRFGRRLVFNIGVVWFTIASAVCALAPSVELLIAARVLQGVGGALLTPGSLAIIEATFRAEDRARASARGRVWAASAPRSDRCSGVIWSMPSRGGRFSSSTSHLGSSWS